MEFEFSEEQEIFRRSVREFCRKKVVQAMPSMESEGKIPDDVIRGMAELGLIMMPVSQEYGGMGADAVTTGIAGEEIARADVSCALAVFFLVQAAWGYIMDKYGKPDAKKEILPKAAKGRAFLGIATTEPLAGSDLASIRTTAVKKGSMYLLNGEKIYTSGTREVTEQLDEGGGFLTLAKTDPDRGTRGMTLFYIPINEVKGEVKTTLFKEFGRRGISTGGFSMKDVEVPEDYVVGEVNKGFHIAMEGFDFARSLISVVCVGAAMSSIDMVINYVKQRLVFGQPLAKFQNVQFKIAENYAKLDAVRLLGYRALWMYDKEQKEGKFSRFEVTKVAAEAKMLAPVIAFEAINEVLQFFGGFGYTIDCPVQYALRGVRSYWWAEGAVEVMKMIVARELIGRDYVSARP